MKRLSVTLLALTISIWGFTVIGSTRSFASGGHRGHVPISDPWVSLPFTAREWARQTLLPYRKIPLKNGGTMSVQDAYDLYLKAEQPPYPDMSTPGLVTDDEIREQMKLSENAKKKG